MVEVHLALTSRLEAEEAAVELELVVELDQVAIDNASLLFTILSFISKMEFRTITILSKRTHMCIFLRQDIYFSYQYRLTLNT